MGDYTSTVRFIGDATSLLNAYRQIKSEALALQKEINSSGSTAANAIATRNGVQLTPFADTLRGAVNARKQLGAIYAGMTGDYRETLFKLQNPGKTFNLRTATGQPIGIKPIWDTKNPYVKAATTDVDLLNKTFVTTASIMKRAADGSEQLQSTFKTYHGNTDLAFAAEQRLNEAISNSIPLYKANKEEIKAAGAAYKPYLQAIEQAKTTLYGPRQFNPDVPKAGAQFNLQGGTGILAQAKEAKAALRDSQDAFGEARRNVLAQQQYIASLNKQSSGHYVDPTTNQRVSVTAARQELNQLNQILEERRSIMVSDEAKLDALRAQAQSTVQSIVGTQNNGLFLSARQQYEQALSARKLIDTQRQAQIDQAVADRQAAELAPTPTPAIWQQLNRRSPASVRKLQQLNVPLNDPEVAKSFRITEDVVHGVSTLNGAWTTQDGVVKNVSLTYDKLGTVITKFNTHLSGLQNWLKQTVTNLQKVVQWGVATSAVLGAVNFARNTITNIITLDKTLQRFSLTANLSRTETKSLFNDLADVAYKTATPLNELVASADDIALATRKAGQTTKEWHDDIIDLSTAVGILTNLTGLDTVKATDLLTSTMKQLHLSSSDLITILNKVTAVGGGQSVAIADIVEGLGNMAEAAQQAGLSIDETIATVQVLSQVTSKSSSEVATAFKNLTGSLDSPGSTKVLEKYNITLKDSQGNLKNILTVYKEINQAIREGRIAASDVKAVVKAIAGGPRRAPDAAALLGAVDQIDEVTQRSKNASNEALLANAKVLDTMAAKITQLQVAWDKLAFSKFGEGIRSGVQTVIDLLTFLLDRIKDVPAGLVATVVQFGALVIVMKTVGAAGKFLIGALGETVLGFRAIGGEAAQAAAQLELFTAAEKEAAIANRGLAVAGAVSPLLGATAGEKLGGLTVKLSKSKLLGPLTAVAAAGAITAGAVASGNANADTGSLLQTIGGAALFAPIPQAKALGVALIGVGTAFSLMGSKASDANKQVALSREELLTYVNANRDAQDTIDSLTHEQNNLIQTYKQLNSDEKSRADNAEVLDATIQRYGETTKELTGANAALTDSYANLEAALAQGGSIDGFATQLRAIGNGAKYSRDSLDQLATEIATGIFTQTNKDFVAPGTKGPELPVGINFLGNGPAGASLSTAKYDNGFYAGQQTSIFTEADLKGPKVLDLFNQFDDKGKLIGVTFNQTAQTFDIIKASLEQLATREDAVGTSAKAALVVFNEQVASIADGNLQLQKFGEFQTSLIKSKQLVGLLTADQAKSQLDNLQTYISAFGATQNLPSYQATNENSTPGLNTQQGAQQFLNDTFKQGDSINGSDVSLDTAKKILDIMGVTTGLEATGVKLTDAQTASLAVGLGIHVALTAELRKQLGITDEETQKIEDAQNKFKSFADQAIASKAQQTADLRNQYLSGSISKTDYQTQSNEANKYIDAVRGIKKAYDDLAGSNPTIADIPFADLNGEALKYAQSLTKIPGLQDATSLSAQDLIGRMLDMADKAHLSGKQLQGLRDKIVLLFEALNTISRVKKEFGFSATMDLSQMIKAVKAMINLPSSFDWVQNVPGHPEAGVHAVANGKHTELSGVLQDLENAQSQISQVTGSGGTGGIGSYYANPTGSGSGSSSKKGGGGSGNKKNVSTLDIPDEIANADNRAALLAEAVRRAKALQSKIPGATKDAKNDIVELLKGTQRVLEVRGVKDDLLRKALEELAAIEKKKLDFETKADVIRRIQVGNGSFAAIANVPVNSQTGVSVGGPNGPITITFNLNGTVLTPAQAAQLANQIAAAIKKQIANG